jgi:hypothetical protein
VGKSIEVTEPERHPLLPVMDAHCVDGGLLGLPREKEWQRGSDEHVLKCLGMSLAYLRDENESFRLWLR